MTTKQITAVNADEQIKQLYQTAFPEEERIPWDDLLRLIGEMHLDFAAYYEGEGLIGFTIVYPRPEFSWFWYFAVKPELRGQGYGQQILSQVIGHYRGQSLVMDERLGSFYSSEMILPWKIITVDRVVSIGNEEPSSYLSDAKLLNPINECIN